MDGYPTNLFPGGREGKKEVRTMAEHKQYTHRKPYPWPRMFSLTQLRILESAIYEVETGVRKIETRVEPYNVQVYRVKLAGGPVIRIDLKKVGGKKDDR